MSKLNMKALNPSAIVTALPKKELDKIVGTYLSDTDTRTVGMSHRNRAKAGQTFVVFKHPEYPNIYTDEAHEYWHVSWFVSPPVHSEEDEDEE